MRSKVITIMSETVNFSLRQLCIVCPPPQFTAAADLSQQLVLCESCSKCIRIRQHACC